MNNQISYAPKAREDLLEIKSFSDIKLIFLISYHYCS